jgi:small-conductance mechanosensitive channel
MRGTRSRRLTRKKQTAKPSKAEHEYQSYYVHNLAEETDPTAILSNILNGIDHLGAQRFGLPPFDEHFRRWSKDITALVTEFESKFPHAADAAYHTTVQTSLSSLQDAFGKRVELETAESKEVAKLQQEHAKCEFERTRLEHEYNSQVAELRRQFGKTKEQLRVEINSLDRERMQLLRKRSSLLQRLLRRPEQKLEQSSSLIQSKRSRLKESQVSLEQSLQERRNDFLATRKKIMKESEVLKAKLDSFKCNLGDDAVEIRKSVCDQLHRAIVSATERAEGSSQPSQV